MRLALPRWRGDHRNPGSPRQGIARGGELAPSLRREHQLAMWRRGLLLPGLRGSLERDNLEFHFELPGGSVIDKLTVGSREFLPGHEEVVVAENRQEAPAHDARLDRGLISRRLSDLHKTAVRAERL